MDTGLAGRVVLVTGGSRGLGRAIALAFAAEGADVAVVARSADALGKTAAAIEEHGVGALAVVADLTSRTECERSVRETVERFGRLDVVVTSAAPEVYGSLASGDDTLFARVDGKLRPAVWCIQAAKDAVVEQRGSVVCIGGTSARQTYNELNDFGAVTRGQSSLAAGMGNAAMANFAKHASDELGPQGVRVNIVHPGMIRSDRLPGRLKRYAESNSVTLREAEAALGSSVALGRVVELEEVAAMVVFLASERASGITGQSIAVDAGALRGVAY